MNKVILIVLMTFISGLFVSCREDEVDGGIIPLKWDIENQAPKDVRIAEDVLSYVVSSDNKGGRVTFTNIDGFSDFFRIAISKRDYNNSTFETLLFRSPIEEDGKTIGFEIWKDDGDEKIETEDLSLEYSNDWCKIFIRYPIVDIEFLPSDREKEDGDIYIEFDMLLRGFRFVLTRK